MCIFQEPTCVNRIIIMVAQESAVDLELGGLELPYTSNQLKVLVYTVTSHGTPSL